MQYATLNNDVKMPVLGLGTYLLQPDDAEASVKFALGHGYELIDTANAYVNEKAVGRGIKASGRAREEVFLETKLWPCFYESDTAVDETLARLGTDYADLMILHQPAADYIHGYQKLEAAYKASKLRAIGISNFNADEVEEVVEKCEVVPAVIQVECHPYFPQTELRRTLAKHGIALQAWYPLGGRGNASIMEEPVIAELAEKHGKTAAQVIMRWHVQMGNIVIPGSKTEAHILDNLDVFDFELSDDDMEAIATLDRGDTIYHRDDESLKRFAAWAPDVDGQK